MITQAKKYAFRHCPTVQVRILAMDGPEGREVVSMDAEGVTRSHDKMGLLSASQTLLRGNSTHDLIEMPRDLAECWGQLDGSGELVDVSFSKASFYPVDGSTIVLLREVKEP